MSLTLNKVSKPVKGIRGYYLIKVIKRTPFNLADFNEKSATIRNMLLQEKRSYFLNQWIAEIKKNADIVDNRYKFFGQ